MKKTVSTSLLPFLFCIFVSMTNAQVRAIYDNGAAGLGQQLKRLQTTASVMHTGAHPDDEDSGLLAYLARKEMARTAYFSLTRGDGGQNVIGSELSEALGVIRTEELLQARRLDGAQQFFTRAMDYGFSKTRKEAAAIWGEEEVLRDMVRAIRMFRPMVIISRFSGTPADGHGQHQLAGYLTPIAFKMAADPKAFPDEGAPWQAKKLYVSQGFSQNAASANTLALNTGEYDPLIGRSYFEIAMEGRSQHKSQEMGVLELRGKFTSGLRLVESVTEKVEKESSVFDGIDTSISGIPKLTGWNLGAQKLDLLVLAENMAKQALDEYRPTQPEKIAPLLAKGIDAIRAARGITPCAQIGNMPVPPPTPEEQRICLDTEKLLYQKQQEFEKAFLMASSVIIDATADKETITPGDELTVGVRAFAPEITKVQIRQVSWEHSRPFAGISKAQQIDEPKTQESGFRPRRETAAASSFYKFSVLREAEPTQPYWLVHPRKTSTFDWPDEFSKCLPFQAPLLTATVWLDINGVTIAADQPVQYRYADDIRGEIRRDVDIVPRVSVALDSGLLIIPASKKPTKHRAIVSITNNLQNNSKGILKLDLPQGWTSSPASAEFDLKTRGEMTAVSFDVTVPGNAKPDDYRLFPQASIDGKIYDQAMQTIAYPHIQTHRIYKKAEVAAKVLDLKVSPVKVGYIMGSGDKVPEAIRRLGLSVTMLEEKDLSAGNLNQFDTIVVGIRASQVRADLVANNTRLLEYVKNGGTLIVQYQQGDYAQKNMMPFPAKIGPRVVDENAKVTILQPKHPVFNIPNKISNDDFKNWVQERNLYCFTDFDKQYVPLLETHDEGEPESNGGMVYAEIGKGKYVYTAYSWFRQLPAGTPGAYRIFANLVSLGAKKK